MALLGELNEPLLSSTLIPPGDEAPMMRYEMNQIRIGVDLILDSGYCGFQTDQRDRSSLMRHQRCGGSGKGAVRVSRHDRGRCRCRWVPSPPSLTIRATRRYCCPSTSEGRQ